MDDYILSMQGICKSFNNVKVLNNVNFDIKHGEVHALVGENGAGKSTLMKILTGVYKMDQGKILLNGKEVLIDNPKKAKEIGISIVHQELSLISSLSVMENIFLGYEPIKNGFIDYNEMKKNTIDILKKLDVDLKPEILINSLNVANKQLVEISKALSQNPKILVFDEPTSSLSQNEIRKLFSVIQKLKSSGVAIIYISHHMDEIFEISDRITVLRDGERIFTGDTNSTNRESIIRYMVGREISSYIPQANHKPDNIVLEVINLSKKGKFNNISFNVRAGEVVGFAGLIGAGRTDVAKAIYGIEKYDSGEIKYMGKYIYSQNPFQMSNIGVAYVPEDRRKEGLLLSTEIYKNISLKYIDRRKIIIKKSEETNLAIKMVEMLRVKCQTIKQKAAELSGGNQQKLILARWLSLNPKLMILDEPTRGIDVNAKVEIYNIIHQLVQKGVAIILISSEMPEILALCDRIEVMKEGRIVKELLKNEATQESIMNYAVGVDKNGY